MNAPATASIEHCLAVLLKLDLRESGGYLTRSEIQGLMLELNRRGDRMKELEGSIELLQRQLHGLEERPA